MKKVFLLMVVTIMISQQASGNVVKKVLPNGLTVLLKEDHSAPIAAINIWFKVGSVNENAEMTGLAHFQEHMVFKGTNKYGVGEIAKKIKAAGGNLNAGTSYSYTMYYIVVPSRAFSLGLSVQADAMMNSTFDPDEFKKERIVVVDEARMYDDTPDSYIFYRTMELGFNEHNYRRPIAGYEKVVRKIKRDQLLDFYNTYYKPSNAVLVIVGDIDPTKAMKEIENTYGQWEDHSSEIYQPPVEPDQEEFRFKEFRGAIDHAYIGIGFHIGDIQDDDYPALEMLSSLLSSGKSSRFFRHLREQKELVTTVNTEVLSEKWPGYFQVYASMPAEKWIDARDAIFEELQEFKSRPAAAEELDKARRQLQKSIYSELETMEGQASNLGYYETMGDYRMAEKHRKAIKRVTAGEIMRAARKYLRLENCSVVSYLPRKWEGAAGDQEAVKKQLAKKMFSMGDPVIPASPAAAESPMDSSVNTPEMAGTIPAREESGIELIKMANGLRILVKNRPAVPLVSMLTLIQGGSRMERRGKSGLSVLTMRSLIKGSESYSAEDIAVQIEGLGGSIESVSSFDVAGVYTSILSENLEEVLPLYRDVLRSPLFLAEEIEKEKSKLLEELAKRHDNPILFSMDSLFADVFGDHPYSKPFLGDSGQLKRLSGEDCRDWYMSLLVPENMVLVFVGDIGTAKAESIADRLFGDLKPGTAPRQEAPIPSSPVRLGMHELKKKNLKQSVTLVGFLAPPMMTGKALSLEVLNGILTGLGGRLFVELRDKRSLGYMAGSAFIPLKDKSIFLGYANPTEDGADEAFKVIMEELSRVTREKIDDEELERAKEWLIGSQIMQLQRNLSQAMIYGTYEVLGFGYDVVDRTPELIQGVTAEDIVKAASNVFKKDQAVFIKLVADSDE